MLYRLKISPPPHTKQCAAGDDFGRLVARPARLLLRTLGVQQKALALIALVALSASAYAITPANSPINNIATASYSIGAVNFTRTGSSLVNTTSCFAQGVKIDLLQHIPAARAESAPNAFNVAIQNSQFASGSATGTLTPQVNPTLLNATSPTALPSTLLLTKLTDALGKPISAFSRNEPIFVRVESYDGNTNGLVKDTINVTLTTSIGGDTEVIQLTETDISSGVFAGAIPTTFSFGASATPYDGNINITAHNETIKAEFTHSDCGTGTIASSSSGLIDPYGIVFDSNTGAPVSGASISLVDSTGAPATVYCDDGVKVLAQPLVSGFPTFNTDGSSCDANAVSGGFRFPLVPSGSYHLDITPPSGYAISTKPFASLPALVGTPAAKPVILGNPGTPATAGGSYGGLFTLWAAHSNWIFRWIPVVPF